MSQIQIINVNYGLASNYGEIIEINEKLKGKLRKKILKHEFAHTKGAYSKKDFKIDFQSKEPYFFESLWFALKNPEALINFFPFMYSYYLRKFTFNVGALILFAYFGLIFVSFFCLGLGISLFNAIFGWIDIFVLFNLVLLVYTHLYVKFKG